MKRRKIWINHSTRTRIAGPEFPFFILFNVFNFYLIELGEVLGEEESSFLFIYAVKKLPRYGRRFHRIVSNFKPSSEGDQGHFSSLLADFSISKTSPRWTAKWPSKESNISLSRFLFGCPQKASTKTKVKRKAEKIWK